jgi:primosomal protein N' (replication factor Y)
MTLYAEVILSLPVSQAFTYIVPESLIGSARAGSRVLVPFSQRMLTGFIIGLRKRRPAPGIPLKEIAEVLDGEPVFSSSFLSFSRKLSDYFYSSWGELLQASLPPSFILKSQTRLSLTDKGTAALEDTALPEEEKKVLSFLQKKDYSLLFLKRRLHLKGLSALLSRLEKRGLVEIQRQMERIKKKRTPLVTGSQAQLELDFSLDTLSRRTADRISTSIQGRAFAPFFLHGPSDKRESVYFQLIKKSLEMRKKVLFLLPEIGVTQALREKFEKRLGERAALLHSRLSERKRELEWLRIKEGEAEVVVGSRSALFAPLDDIGLVVVDEEQDESYYQQESPSYDARKGAWLRAKELGATLVYGSALPRVSAFFRARKRGYLVSLEGEKERKNFKIIDSRREREGISRKLTVRISERLKNKEPVLVFLNRRGYASYIFCPECNSVPRCMRCDIALAFHKRDKSLVCHYCGYSIPVAVDCPDCGSRMTRSRALGVEAVEEELREIFPQSRIKSLAADLSRDEQERVLGSYNRGNIDILIGTQLLARQTDLRPASLVVILFPEIFLTLPDYRASERTFRAVSRMMRFLGPGPDAEAIIQTALPDHFSIRLAARNDYGSFFREELNFRRLLSYPPFSHLVEILFQGENLRSLARQSRRFMEKVKKGSADVEILGPGLAPVAKVRGRARVQVILKASRKEILDNALRDLMRTARTKKTILVYD